MYGSVFKMKAKAGAKGDLISLMDDEMRTRVLKGVRASYLLDGGGDEVWGVAVFDDEKTYRENAASPEQDAAYRRMRALLQADPEWHDGAISAWTAQAAAR